MCSFKCQKLDNLLEIHSQKVMLRLRSSLEIDVATCDRKVIQEAGK